MSSLQDSNSPLETICSISQRSAISSPELKTTECLNQQTFRSSKRSCTAFIAAKKSETELTASVLKKDPKRLKERFLIRRKRTRRANLRGKPLFQATYNSTTENY